MSGIDRTAEPLPGGGGGIGDLCARRGSTLATLAAACAALPGLRFPFLSDDWLQIESISGALPPRTPFGDFRPLFMASLWIDRLIGGLSPAFFHLSNLLWVALAAALVAAAGRRYTGDARLAAVAGLLFALHPFHVENAAWVSARADPLVAILALSAALAYDRWRPGRRGIPLAAILLLEAALLAKESAAALPPALVAIGLLDRSRRPTLSEWLRGLAPLFATALAHFIVLRPWVLGGPGRTLLSGFGPRRLFNGLGYGAAALLPADVESLASRPFAWGALASLAAVALLLLAWRRSGGVPGAAVCGGVVFAVLIAPCLVGFQERYFFLPGAASAVALAALLRAVRGRLAAALGILLAAGWIGAGCLQWSGWRQAALASQALIEGLARASDRAGVAEIVVANQPHRVAGGSVAGDLRAALRLSGGRPLAVRAACFVSYPTAAASGLDGPPGISVRRPPPFAEVWLRIAEGPFSHYIGPLPPGAGLYDGIARSLDGPVATLLFDGRGGVRVRIPPDPSRGRAAYVWADGRLEPLF